MGVVRIKPSQVIKMFILLDVFKIAFPNPLNLILWLHLTFANIKKVPLASCFWVQYSIHESIQPVSISKQYFFLGPNKVIYIMP